MEIEFKRAYNYIILLFLIMGFKNEKGGLKLYEQEISRSFEGVVVDKVATRPNMNETHIKIRTQNNEVFLVSVFLSTIEKLKISDSVYKLKDENFIYLTRNNKKLKYRFINKTTEEKLKEKYPNLKLN
ncbi:hypothetical protein LB465_03215 [Salegentibacter sp. LM13S]|uniref:hypothetical protein n=1 Tax=Salegentibacter lacus TaxID=2873599 RepID=UPI001CCB7EA9|nr:hypothetical protein [Salegentibacter lacus]MBZ9629777.1 hypothetical protein [Salegentibacter lacus]